MKHKHTSASLTDYITQLPASLTTANTKHICQPHWLQKTQTHICQPHWLENSTASLTDYRNHKHICQPHWLHNSTDSLTDYRKHKHTSVCLSDYRTQLPASMTTGNTNTSASLTDYRTQLPASPTTGNTNTHLPASLTTELNCQPHWLQQTQTHICQPHWLQNSQRHLYHYSRHIPRKNTEWSINIQSTHTSRWSVGRWNYNYKCLRTWYWTIDNTM